MIRLPVAASKHLGSSDPFDASGMGPLAQQFNDQLGHGKGLPAGTMAAMTPNHQEGACGGWGRGARLYVHVWGP